MERSKTVPKYSPPLGQRITRSRILSDDASFTAPARIACLAAVILLAASITAMAEPFAPTQGIGSVGNYMQTDPSFYEERDPEDPYDSPLLGIEVKSATADLRDGRLVKGVEVVRVVTGSPGGVAGLRGSSPGGLRTTFLFVGMVAGAALFPPAMFGLMALSKIGEPHETIIAVDGERTRNVIDFEEAIENARPGEIAYLTVVNGGQRQQVRVLLGPNN